MLFSPTIPKKERFQSVNTLTTRQRTLHLTEINSLPSDDLIVIFYLQKLMIDKCNIVRSMQIQYIMQVAFLTNDTGHYFFIN